MRGFCSLASQIYNPDNTPCDAGFSLPILLKIAVIIEVMAIFVCMTGGVMSDIIHVHISELQGGMPDVPLADGVDYSALVAGDVNPVFLTLPLIKAGTVSRNGRRYDADAVSALVEQINRNRPNGILGHLPEGERSTRFDLPSLMWVGARLDADGMAWGKAYIPEYAGNVREYVLKSKARRAPVATSIYGTAEIDGDMVRNLAIEGIDLVDPSRAGVPDAVAEPVITSETVNQEGDMPENNQELIAELRNERNSARQELTDARREISELTAVAETMATIREMVGEGDVVESIREMREVVARHEAETRRVRIGEAVTTALGDIAKNPKAASIIREMVGDVQSAEEATARVGELLEKEHVKVMLKALVVESAGPGAVVGANAGGNDKPKVSDDPQSINNARKSWNF